MKEYLDIAALLITAFALDAVALWYLAHRPRRGD